MRSCLLLLKIQMLGFFSLGKLLRSRRVVDKLKLVGFGLVVLGAGALFGFLSYKLSGALALIDLTRLLPPLLLALCALMTLVTTILKANGLLFGYRDYDLVMSLPIKSGTVIASRLLTLYVTTLLMDAVIYLPGVYFYATRGGSAGWGMLLLGLVLGPLLPIAVGALISVLLTLLLARLPYKNLLMVLFSFGFFFLAMFFSVWIQTGGRAYLLSLEKLMQDLVYRIYPPARLFTQALAGPDWRAMGLFVLVSLGAAAVFVAVFALGFRRINTLVTTRVQRRAYRVRAQKKGGVLGAIYRVEARRFFTNATYVLNTIVGAVIWLLIGVSSFFWKDSSFLWAFSTYGLTENLGSIAAITAAFCMGMSSTTCCSLSLDGPTRWVLYSSPVRPRTIFHAKLLLNLSITLPVSLVGGGLLAYNLSLGAMDTLVVLSVAVAFSLFAAVYGLWINFKLPQYDWTNPFTVIKRGMSVFITIFTGLGLTALMAFLAYKLNDLVLPEYEALIRGRAELVLFNNLVMLAAAGLLTLCAGVLYLSLRRKRLFL